MAPWIAAVVVFIGTFGALGLLFLSSRTVRTASSLELARRLGPREDALRLTQVVPIDTLGAWLGPPGRWLHRLSVRAGSTLTVTRILGLSVGWGVAGVLLLSAIRPGPMAAMGALLGALPVVWLAREAKHRNRLLTEQIPDAFDLIGRALRSGHAFPEALRLAANELPAPVRDVLGPTAEQNRLGMDLRACLDDLVERVPENFAIRLFASSVLLHRETGGNLIEILEGLADTVRERVIFEEKVLALTAEVRLSARILEALPFVAAIAILFASPTYLDPLFRPGPGRALLLGAALMMLAGVLLIRNISQVRA